MEPGALTLVRSGLGWHLVEVLEKRPSIERGFSEARADVLAALEAVKRDHGLKIYRRNLRERDKHKVEVFPEVLARPPREDRWE
ncbi:MAG: hypothetical protein GWO24_00730 [Akkermansiaceae bacterium]|nr:hypothetical protein [Akkermansiaceae bacterium]